MGNFWFSIGAGLAGLGVILGAFGAHGLKDLLTPERLTIWETASRYHLIHALGLMLIGAMAPRLAPWAVSTAGWLLCAGILIFSGSLYALALTDIRVLGAITPLGGLSFILAWSLLAYSAYAR